MNENSQNTQKNDVQNNSSVNPTENNSYKPPINPDQPQIIDENLTDIAMRKKVEIAKKKRIYDKVMLMVKIIILANILLYAGVKFYKWQQKNSASPFDVKGPDTAPTNINVVIDDTNPLTWQIFKSDNVKVFIRHPQSAKVIESNTPALKAEAIYDSKNTNVNEFNEKTLKDGYIFRVTPLDVGLRNIDEITNIKMQSFREKCPATASFSIVKKELVDTIDARTFEISNCEVDYVVSYIPRFGIYYEIAQIFTGDFGVRQKYKGITGEMLRAFHFYPEDTRPVGPFKTYIDEKNGFLIAHPNLDETCCAAPEPPKTDTRQTMSRLFDLGDRNTFRDKDNFDGISMFTVPQGSVQNFDAFVQTQRNYLTEDYKVVVGSAPITQDIQVQIGKYTGITLKGYTWRKNDLIYVPVGNKTYIFSVKNLTGERFEKTVTDMLNSFETFGKE